jgi:hypothetical protein
LYSSADEEHEPFLSFFLSSVVEKESVYKREKRIKKRIPTRTSLSLSLSLSLSCFSSSSLE